MKRAVRARACAAGATAACMVALGLGTVVTQAGAAYAAGAQDVRIPAPNTSVPRDVTVVAAGVDGVLDQEEGTAGYQFVSTANRQVKPVPVLDGVPRDAIFRQGADADVFAYTTSADGPTQVVWDNIETGSEYRLTLQDGYLHPHIQRYAVIVSQKLDDGTYQYRIVRPIESTVSDVVLPLPPGATGDADPVVLANNGVTVVVGYQQDGHPAFGLVNMVDGTVVPLPAESDATSFSLTDSWIAWFSRQGTAGERIIAPGYLGKENPGVLPLSGASATGAVHTFQVGNNILWYEGDHGPLNLTPIHGNETARVVLPDVSQGLQEPTGALDLVNQSADGTRTVDNLSVNGAGLVSDLPLRTLAPVTYYGSVQGLSLDRGTARFANLLRGKLGLVGKDVGTGLQPVAGADLPEQDGAAPGRFADGGDEGLARLVTDPATGHDALVTADDPTPIVLPATGGRILDVSPQYVLYEAGDVQYVVDIAQNKVVRQRPASAAALDYATLWTPSTTSPGTVVGTNLRTGATTRTVDLGGDCTPVDLRTNGRLMYWRCHRAGSTSDFAQVKDLSTGWTFDAPATDVLLGDHFMAARPQNSTVLDIFEFPGTVELSVGTITGLKPTSAADTRGITWTVDRRSGQLAYVDANDVVHVTRALPDTSPVSQLSVPDQVVPASFDARGGAGRWNAQWWLSKPAASWQVALKDARTGQKAGSWSGGATRSSLRVTWDGKNAAGDLMRNDRYTWTLTVTPADGSGPVSETKDDIAMTGATPYPSGLFARDTTGTLWQYSSTGKASAPYSAREKVGGGWQSYTALTTTNGQRADGAGDMVARDASGVLWYYQGSTAHTPPLAPRVRVGGGWNTYDRLVGARDLTGDGRADLIARDRSGVLWLYKGTGSVSAPFAARVRIGGGWNAYGTLTATGDVTGDGRADLVARDGSGVLWLYRGTGSASAPFAARTKIGGGWNTFSALAGTGDVTGDGRADLVARDGSGVLWLYRGTGSASAPFAARTKVGGGWNTYNALI